MRPRRSYLTREGIGSYRIVRPIGETDDMQRRAPVIPDRMRCVRGDTYQDCSGTVEDTHCNRGSATAVPVQ